MTDSELLAAIRVIIREELTALQIKKSRAMTLQAVPPNLCAYCLRVSSGAVNGIRHCSDHTMDAMGMKPRPRMPGVTPKAVAGND